LEENGINFRQKSKTLYTECPGCNRADKFSILKSNGSTVCYHGSCDWSVRPFHEYVAAILNISPKEAKSQIYATDYTKELKFEVGKSTQQEEWDPLNTANLNQVVLPEKTYSVVDTDNEGSAYLRKRGIEPKLADIYGIKYCFSQRRVIFPAYVNGKLVGYQGRSVDPVAPYLKVRNNDGFRRDQTVLFWDKVRENEFIIIAEGPFDALKFSKIGNFVSTMGKEITQKQIILMKSKNPQKVYIALDDDAAEEMSQLARSFDVPTFLLRVPQSCRLRCKELDKKADFGECTPDEAQEAFNNAEQLGYYNLIVNWEK